jgi:hypothetical protein
MRFYHAGRPGRQHAPLPLVKENGKNLVKTLAIWPLHDYNMNDELTRCKRLFFNNLQHQSNIKATCLVGSQARLRAWLGLNPVQVQVLSPAL